MNSGEKRILTGAKDTIVKWLIGLALTCLVTAVGFYFNTNYVMAQNTNNIEKQNVDIKLIKDEVQKIKTIPVINQQQIKSIKKDVDRIEKSTDKINDKIDKMMNLLIEIKTK